MKFININSDSDSDSDTSDLDIVIEDSVTTDDDYDDTTEYIEYFEKCMCDVINYQNDLCEIRRVINDQIQTLPDAAYLSTKYKICEEIRSFDRSKLKYAFRSHWIRWFKSFFY